MFKRLFIMLIPLSIGRQIMKFNVLGQKLAGFRTMIIGGSEKAIEIYNEIQSLPKGTGNMFVGFINLNGVDRQLEKNLTYLGHVISGSTSVDSHSHNVTVANNGTHLHSVSVNTGGSGVALNVENAYLGVNVFISILRRAIALLFCFNLWSIYFQINECN